MVHPQQHCPIGATAWRPDDDPQDQYDNCKICHDSESGAFGHGDGSADYSVTLSWTNELKYYEIRSIQSIHETQKPIKR